MVEAPAQLTRVAVARHRGLPISERRLLLAVLDSGAVALAFLAAFNLRTAPVRDELFQVPRVALAICVAGWLVSGHIAGAYDLRRLTTIAGNLRVVLATLGFTLVVLLGVFFVAPYRITRPTLLLWVPLALVLVLAGRTLYVRVLASSYFAGRIGLVIPREGLEAVWDEVQQAVGPLYSLVATIDPKRPDATERLHALLDEHAVDQIVLGVRDDMSRDLFRGVLACHERGVVVRSLADLYEEVTGRMLLDQLGHTWLTALPMRGETSRLYASFKRAIDVMAALLALTVLGVVLVPVALVSLLTDRGPLFHSQVRVGKYGRHFRLAKLRTMRLHGDGDTSWTQRGDDRITPVGRVLRPLHLDELPQAWSILRGDMSLIGPRPEQPQYVDELRSRIDFYNTRLTVRPGLTGWAQVNYGYGSGVDGARVKLSYDLYYIKRQSAALDLLIAGRTVMTVLSLGGR